MARHAQQANNFFYSFSFFTLTHYNVCRIQIIIIIIFL